MRDQPMNYTFENQLTDATSYLGDIGTKLLTHFCRVHPDPDSSNRILINFDFDIFYLRTFKNTIDYHRMLIIYRHMQSKSDCIQ